MTLPYQREQPSGGGMVREENSRRARDRPRETPPPEQLTLDEETEGWHDWDIWRNPYQGDPTPP